MRALGQSRRWRASASRASDRAQYCVPVKFIQPLHACASAEVRIGLPPRAPGPSAPCSESRPSRSNIPRSSTHAGQPQQHLCTLFGQSPEQSSSWSNRAPSAMCAEGPRAGAVRGQVHIARPVCCSTRCTPLDTHSHMHTEPSLIDTVSMLANAGAPANAGPVSKRRPCVQTLAL